MPKKLRKLSCPFDTKNVSLPPSCESNTVEQFASIFEAGRDFYGYPWPEYCSTFISDGNIRIKEYKIRIGWMELTPRIAIRRFSRIFEEVML